MRKISYSLMAATLSAMVLVGGANNPIYAATFQQYNAISLDSGGQVVGQLNGKSDMKYYKLTTQQKGGLYLSFENLSAPIEAQLLDENGNQVAYLNTPLSENKKLEASVPAGTYYVRVRSYLWDNSLHTGTYTIKTTYTTSEATGTQPDGGQNETKDNAVLIRSGDSYQGKLISNVDVNYYKLLPRDSGDLYVRLENISAPIKVELLDENNNLVTTVDTANTSDMSNAPNIKNKALDIKVNVGTYYLRVTTSAIKELVQNSTYSITATYTTNNVAHKDDFEPNDIMDSAYRIHSGMEYKKDLTSNIDRDYYKLQTDYDGQIKLDVTNAGNPILTQLFDENGNMLGSSYTNTLAPIFVKKGTYFVKVSPLQWADDSKGSYTLKASFSEEEKITVNVNGTPLSLDQQPTIHNGRTLVPLRGVLEALGAKVDWDNSTQTVTVSKDDNKILIPIGSNTATINGKSVSLDVPAEMIKDRTMIPLRFISQALNDQVNWDEENQTVNVTTK